MTFLLLALAIGGVSGAGYYTYDRYRKKNEAIKLEIKIGKIEFL